MFNGNLILPPKFDWLPVFKGKNLNIVHTRRIDLINVHTNPIALGSILYANRNKIIVSNFRARLPLNFFIVPPHVSAAAVIDVANNARNHGAPTGSKGSAR